MHALRRCGAPALGALGAPLPPPHPANRYDVLLSDAATALRSPLAPPHLAPAQLPARRRPAGRPSPRGAAAPAASRPCARDAGLHKGGIRQGGGSGAARREGGRALDA